VRPGVADDTVRRIEQATGRLATQSVARMDEQLAWFRELPADQRSWVSLVAQAGLQSFVEWLRSPDDVLRLTGEVFAAAPRAMARSVTLQQTVELIRETIAVAEASVPSLAGPTDEHLVSEELLRFSREIAFAAARVYASAAESRGSWDDRLEALIIDGMVRGTGVGDALPSQFAALGWQAGGPIAVLAGSAPDGPNADALDAAHTLARALGTEIMAGVHGGRLVVVLRCGADPVGAATTAHETAMAAAAETATATATGLLPAFGPGPVVLSPPAADLGAASAVTRAALSGLRAAPAWPGAPRPVPTEALLPERALAGDEEARAELIRTVYRPLVASGDVLTETVTAYLDSAGALEATARALFVHPNTVRYRLRRVTEVCGEAPATARGAFALRVALALGRLEAVSGE
jgi:hypothetical protein